MKQNGLLREIFLALIRLELEVHTVERTSPETTEQKVGDLSIPDQSMKLLTSFVPHKLSIQKILLKSVHKFFYSFICLFIWCNKNTQVMALSWINILAQKCK